MKQKEFKKVKIKMLADGRGQDVNAEGVSYPDKKYLKGQEYVVSEVFAKALGSLCEVVVVAAKAPLAPGAGAPVAPPAPSSENKDAGPVKAPSQKVK